MIGRLIDRLADWADRHPNESMGEHYTRCLGVLFWAYVTMGFGFGLVGRREAFEVATELRVLEAALDPEGLSTTARAVLARIRAAR